MYKRCIVYATGFYEWRHFDSGKVKIPYYIYSKDEKILRMGGIWAEWTNKETGEMFQTFALVTVPANQLMAKIHNSKLRMPLLFDKDQAARWLDKSISKEDVQQLMCPCSDEYLKAHTVGTLISSPKVPLEQKNTRQAQIEELYPDWIKD